MLNLLSWCDEKLIALKDAILARTKNKKNYLRSVCGLPVDMSVFNTLLIKFIRSYRFILFLYLLILFSCFSGIKIKWLIENNKAVQESIRKKECYFGNLDSWIVWNLTGGQSHCTDVTNASRTLLMDLETLQWNKRLCNFFNIPMSILPKIRSNSEIYGYVKMDGSSVLEGIPIASVMGDKNSALLGQLCLKPGQIECHFENDCSLMINTGQEIVHSENDLLTTIGFQLGPNEKPFYALEGYIGNACATVDWLKNSILPESNNNFDDNISPVSSFIGMRNGGCFKKFREEEIIFVPALKGLCAPNFLHQAKGFISGLTINTTSHQLFIAAKESICFQTKTILESIRKDCKTWPSISKIVVGGEFTENVDFLQLLADLCSITVERPQISPPVSLGSMLSAALTLKCITLEDFKKTYKPPTDTYNSTINPDISDQRYVKWLSIFRSNLYVNGQNPREQVHKIIEAKTAHQYILDSLPGCLYLFSSYVIYVLSQLAPKS